MGYTAVPTLMYITLGGVLLIAIVAFIWFRRKPQNRHPMDGKRERNIDEIRRDVPPGQ